MKRVIKFETYNCELQTPCPYGMRDEDDNIRKVNSFECRRCSFFYSSHKTYGKIYCTHK